MGCPPEFASAPTVIGFTGAVMLPLIPVAGVPTLWPSKYSVNVVPSLTIA